MISIVIANGIRFLALMVIQVFLLDHLDLYDGMVVPYLYILFLFMLPFDIEHSFLMVIGFITGLIMDIFSNTPGMHTSACVLICFIRPYFLQWISPREGYEFGLIPRIQHMGVPWFITYIGVLILVHHTWLFFVEVYMLDRFLETFARVLFSGIFTAALCILAQFLSFSPRRT